MSTVVETVSVESSDVTILPACADSVMRVDANDLGVLMANDAESISAESARERLFEMAFQYALPRCLFVAAELGVADAVADEPKSATDLAAELDVHAMSLERVLRLLVKHQVFAEDEAGRYSLTAMSSLMCSGVDGSLRDFLRFDDETLWNSYGHLLHAVRTGQPGFDHIKGFDFFQYLMTDHAAAGRVDSAQRSLSEAEERVIAQIYDFSGIETVVDLGGGRGGLLTEILRAHPSLSGILLDQEHAVQHPARLVEAGLLDRCAVQAGDFFAEIPSGFSLYTIKRVLHDWDDESCVRILTKVREALADGGRALIIEGVRQPDDAASLIRECDIAMMSFLPGFVRTQEAFESLFAAAGLRLRQVLPVTSLVSILEAEVG